MTDGGWCTHKICKIISAKRNFRKKQVYLGQRQFYLVHKNSAGLALGVREGRNMAHLGQFRAIN